MHELATHHALEEGDLPARLWHRVVVVALRLVAVQQRLFGLGPADEGRPPDPRQQAGGATHRVVGGAGGLLVPGFGRLAGEKEGHGDARHGESGGLLHTHERFGRLLFCAAVEVRMRRFRWRTWSRILYRPTRDVHQIKREEVGG